MYIGEGDGHRNHAIFAVLDQEVRRTTSTELPYQVGMGKFECDMSSTIPCSDACCGNRGAQLFRIFASNPVKDFCITNGANETCEARRARQQSQTGTRSVHNERGLFKIVTGR